LRQLDARLGKSNKKQKNPWKSPVSPSTGRRSLDRGAPSSSLSDSPLGPHQIRVKPLSLGVTPPLAKPPPRAEKDGSGSKGRIWTTAAGSASRRGGSEHRRGERPLRCATPNPLRRARSAAPRLRGAPPRRREGGGPRGRSIAP
jgi:hypothetical protein